MANQRKIWVACGLLLAAAILLGLTRPAVAEIQSCRQLHDAVFLDEPDEVSEILESGVSVNCRNEIGQTPLMTSAEVGSLECLVVLLKRGAAVNLRDAFGETALAYAQKKVYRFQKPDAAQLRRLFLAMVERLQRVGARL